MHCRVCYVHAVTCDVHDLSFAIRPRVAHTCTLHRRLPAYSYSDFCGFLETNSKDIAADIYSCSVRELRAGLPSWSLTTLSTPLPLFLLLCGVLEVCNKLAKGAFLTVTVVKVLDAFYCIVCKFGICSHARIGGSLRRGEAEGEEYAILNAALLPFSLPLDGWRLRGKRKSESHIDEFSTIISVR